jgi:competence protein ComEA
MHPLRRSRRRYVDPGPDGWGRGPLPQAGPVDPEEARADGDRRDAQAVHEVHRHPGDDRRVDDGSRPEERFPREELFPPEERYPPEDRFSSGAPLPREERFSPGEGMPHDGASTAHVAPTLPGPRPRVRLRVGIGAAVALVGAALVVTILVTAFQAAAGDTPSGAASASGSATASHDASRSPDADAAAGASSGAGADATGAGPDAAASDGADTGTGTGTGAGAGDGSAGDQAGTGSRTPIYVHVVGAVVSPGLFPLAPGSRVVDALAAAHGFADGADPAGVNLARVLTDGEQLVVPRQGEAPAPAASGSAAASPTGASPSTPVDLNTATAEQLETLPRVGPSLAARIIAWRSAHGRFARVADLGRVPGIGDRTLASLTPLVRV